MFSKAIFTKDPQRVLPSLSVPVQTLRTFTHAALSSEPHFSPAQGCQSLYQRCHSRTVPWPCLLDIPQSCAVLTFPDLSPAFPRWTLDMTHYLTLSRTVNGPSPITTPVLLNFGLVIKVAFPACSACGLLSLKKQLCYSFLLKGRRQEYKVDCFNQRKTLTK